MKRKLNYEYWYGVITSILVILFLFFVGSLFYLFYHDYKTSSKIDADPENIDAIINDCSNLTITESAYCVKGITKNFYKYNMSNIEKELSFTKLKNHGGVCESWSDYWCKIGDELGYDTKKVYLNIGTCEFEYKGVYKDWGMNHVICFWSNENVYIRFDGLNLNEVELDNSYCGRGEWEKKDE